jgi:glycosyltransferase involved in cell wall biosynthesis
MLGIGVITYNNCEALKRTLKAIKEFTKVPYHLIVADDGSNDNTIKYCQEAGIPVVTGTNRGVAWNKNRALYPLLNLTNADPIILLEDDCFPVAHGWDKDWIEAAQGYHHVNYAHIKWPKNWCLSGDGTPKKPWRTKYLTAQASITTRAALNKVGYYDTRFRGFGYGHIEWTCRFCKAKYIGRFALPTIRCGLGMEDLKTTTNKREMAQNRVVFYQRIHRTLTYCAPWQNDQEKEQLLLEVALASKTLE